MINGHSDTVLLGPPVPSNMQFSFQFCFSVQSVLPDERNRIKKLKEQMSTPTLLYQQLNKIAIHNKVNTY